MKKTFLILCILLISIIGKAADLVIDGISYNVLSWADLTLEVVPSKTIYGESTYSGDIIIPGKIESGSNIFTVVSIGENAFCNNEKITSITIPNTVRTIKTYAFYSCVNLESVKMSNSIITIEDIAFNSCHKLKNIELPNSLISMGSSVFSNCENLEEIIIPNSVSSMGTSVFMSCTNLTKATVGTGLSSLPGSTFYGCKNLRTVILPEGLTTIGNNAFNGCDALTTISIPNSVTDINRGFQYCHNLRLLILGESVSSIDLLYLSSERQTPLSIVCLGTTPPTATFSYKNDEDYVALYVPIGYKEVYQASSWKNVKSIIEGLPSDMIYPVNTNCHGKGFVLSCGNYIEEGEATSNVQIGTRIPIVAIPDDGYAIRSLKINGNEVSDKVHKYTCFIDSLCEATTIFVEFDSIPEEKQSTLKLDISEGGFINVKDNNITNEKTELEIPMGDACLFVIPNDGYRLNTFFVDGDDMIDSIINNQYKFTSAGEKISIKATFKEDKTADVNKDGVINAADVVSIYNHIISGE